MKENYQYPIFDDWSTAELTAVCKLYQLVEDFYELDRGVERTNLLAAYAAFQQVVPAKGEQRSLERQFKRNSGYDVFQAVKAAGHATSKRVRANG